MQWRTTNSIIYSSKSTTLLWRTIYSSWRAHNFSRLHLGSYLSHSSSSSSFWWWSSCWFSQSPSSEQLHRSGARFSKVPRTFRARKVIRKTTTSLFCKAGLFICCKGNKNKNNCKVSCLETPSFWRYKENYVTRNTPEKFRDFQETGPWTEKLSFTALASIGRASLLCALALDKLTLQLPFLVLHGPSILTQWG